MLVRTMRRVLRSAGEQCKGLFTLIAAMPEPEQGGALVVFGLHGSSAIASAVNLEQWLKQKDEEWLKAHNMVSWEPLLDIYTEYAREMFRKSQSSIIVLP